MKRSKLPYFIIGMLVAVVIGGGAYIYHEKTKPEGIQLNIGENGVKLEAN